MSTALQNAEPKAYEQPGTSRSLDILGLEPETSYQLEFMIKSQGGMVQKTDMTLDVKTSKIC